MRYGKKSFTWRIIEECDIKTAQVKKEEYLDCGYIDFYNRPNKQCPKEKKAKGIIQLNKKTLKPIKVWANLTEASMELKIDLGNICACAKGSRFSAGGFCWKYTFEG